MDAEAADDELLDLLSYNCPITGKTRVPGYGSPGQYKSFSSNWPKIHVE